MDGKTKASAAQESLLTAKDKSQAKAKEAKTSAAKAKLKEASQTEPYPLLSTIDYPQGTAPSFRKAIASSLSGNTRVLN